MLRKVLKLKLHLIPSPLKLGVHSLLLLLVRPQLLVHLLVLSQVVILECLNVLLILLDFVIQLLDDHACLFECLCVDLILLLQFPSHLLQVDELLVFDFDSLH